MKKKSQPQIRNIIARLAWEKTGAGKHGGTAHMKNKRDRKAAKQELRDE